jgi:hypothetical protein
MGDCKYHCIDREATLDAQYLKVKNTVSSSYDASFSIKYRQGNSSTIQMSDSMIP